MNFDLVRFASKLADEAEKLPHEIEKVKKIPGVNALISVSIQGEPAVYVRRDELVTVLTDLHRRMVQAATETVENAVSWIDPAPVGPAVKPPLVPGKPKDPPTVTPPGDPGPSVGEPLPGRPREPIAPAEPVRPVVEEPPPATPKPSTPIDPTGPIKPGTGTKK